MVVGSGFGGAFAASRLTQAGMKTVLLERGSYVRRDDGDWDQEEILVRERYRGPSPLQVKQLGARTYTAVCQNETVGGMSVFYGGASLRLREVDFEGWPIGYADLAPYYAEAEWLLGVHGEAGSDPLEPERGGPYPHPPVDLSAPAARIRDAALSLGLRPFRIPLAINFSDPARPQCVRCVTCDGFPCKVRAKNDVAVTVLGEAQNRGLTVMAGAVVRDLKRSGDRVVSASCVDANTGVAFDISGGTFVVSAGAIGTPALLLRSGLDQGDRSGSLGRYLMRHCNAAVAGVFPHRTNPDQVFHKQICVSDLYEDMREELGTATGVIQEVYTPSAPVVKHFAPRGAKWVAAAAAGHLQNLLCVAEDEPRAENVVTLGTDLDLFGIPVTHVVHDYTRDDVRRRSHLIAQARRILRRAGAVFTKLRKIDSFSHALGSARFGATPDAGVLDPDCRIWHTDNVYVADASFMPTSGGVNPSLTISANALRVAEAICTRMG